MFDYRVAFVPLNGRTFTPLEFRKAVLQIRIDHQRDIASEIEVEDLIVFVRRRGWLKESANEVRVEIPEEA